MLLHRPVIFINVDNIQALQLFLIEGQGLDSIFQKHLSINLIENHDSRRMNGVLFSNNFFPQQLVVYFILLSLDVMVHKLP